MHENKKQMMMQKRLLKMQIKKKYQALHPRCQRGKYKNLPSQLSASLRCYRTRITGGCVARLRSPKFRKANFTYPQNVK